MKTRKLLWLLPLCFLLLASVLNGCDEEAKAEEIEDTELGDDTEPVDLEEYTDLHYKPLDVIKRYIKGEWKIVSRSGGFTGSTDVIENTYIRFESNYYTWIKNDISKRSKLNWRKEQPPRGEEYYVVSIEQISEGATFSHTFNNMLYIQAGDMYFNLEKIK
jgi:hypothetical protein